MPTVALIPGEKRGVLTLPGMRGKLRGAIVRWTDTQVVALDRDRREVASMPVVSVDRIEDRLWLVTGAGGVTWVLKEARPCGCGD